MLDITSAGGLAKYCSTEEFILPSLQRQVVTGLDTFLVMKKVSALPA